jgi:cytochrome c556
MGYRAAAVMEVILNKAPEKDMGTKTRKVWLDSAQRAYQGALKLAAAAREKNGPELKAAAAQANTACNDCHSEFK